MATKKAKNRIDTSYRPQRHVWATTKTGRKAIPVTYTIWDALMAAGVPVRSGRKSQLRDKNATIGVNNSAHKRLLANTGGSAAVDVTPLPGYTWDDVMVSLADPDLQDYFKYHNIGFLDERNPKYFSWKATGPHFHIGVGAGSYKTPGSTGPGLKSWNQIYKVGNPYWSTIDWYNGPAMIGDNQRTIPQETYEKPYNNPAEIVGMTENNPYELPEITVEDNAPSAWNTMLAANNTMSLDSPLLNTKSIDNDIDYHYLESNPYTPLIMSPSLPTTPLLADVQTPYTDAILGRVGNYAAHGGPLGNYFDGLGDTINRLTFAANRMLGKDKKPASKFDKRYALRMYEYMRGQKKPYNPLEKEINKFNNQKHVSYTKLDKNGQPVTDYAALNFHPIERFETDENGKPIDPTNNFLNWAMFGGAGLARLGIGAALQSAKDIGTWLKPGHGGGNLIGTTAGAKAYDMTVQGLTGKTVGQNLHDIAGIPEWLGDAANPMWYFGGAATALSPDEQLLSRLRSNSAERYFAEQVAKRKAATVSKMKASSYVPGIVRYSYDRGSLSAPLEYGIAHSPIGKRAIEMAMRASNGSQAADLHRTLPGIARTLFGRGDIWRARRNYLLFGRRGSPDTRYNSFTGNNYTGIGDYNTETIFTPLEGYGDFIDTYLYNKPLDPRIARPIGRNYGTMEEYINTNYPHKKIPMYETNSYAVISESGEQLNPLLKASTPMPQKVIGYPSNQDLLLREMRTADVGGHQLIEGNYNGTPVYAEQDIWKFLPRDYIKKWFKGDIDPSKKQLIKTGLYMVDEAGTPFVVKTPFAPSNSVIPDLLKIDPAIKFNSNLFQKSAPEQLVPFTFKPTSSQTTVPLSELPIPEAL